MSSRYNALATFFRAPGNVYQVFTLVDCVAAGNNWLWDKAIEHGAHTVTVQVDENAGRIPMHAPHTNERPLTNGCLGSEIAAKYLSFIEPLLQDSAPVYRYSLRDYGRR
jgi:hypothetical protein